MTRTVASFVLTIVVLSSGCHSARDPRREAALQQARAEALSEIDQTDCQRKGGSIQHVGMLGTPSCVVPYRDAGKPCKDRSECEGYCKAPEGLAEGSAATGSCSRDSADHFGCNAAVEGGFVGITLCAD